MPFAAPWRKRPAGPALLAAAALAGLYAYGVARAGTLAYALPAALIALCLGVLLAFTRVSGAFALLLLTLPLSVELPLGAADHKLLVPSEGLMAVLGISFGTGLLLRRPPDWQLLRHPLTRLVLLYLGVLTLATLASAQLVVSLKYTLVNGAYVAIFYLLAYDFLARYPARAPTFFFLYGAPMLLVIGYALYHHSTVGFYHDASGIVVRPFFTDHTLYSACLSLLLPAFVVCGWRGQHLGLSPLARRFAAGAAGLMAVAIFFSYSRATWAGIGIALLGCGALRLRLRPGHVGALLLLVLAGAGLYHDELLQRMKLNRHSSTSQHVDLAEQTMSVTNISSDVSNAERLNRWSCAWRMFLDRPLTGFGPGTYQFEYLAYQRADEMTRISVTTPYNNTFGRGGSAHSEYLLALSESGLPGFLLFTAIVLAALATALRTYARAPDVRTRLLVGAAYAGLIAFSTHVLFNNFLNNNKAAALFWGQLALLVLLDNRSRGSVVDKAC